MRKPKIGDKLFFVRAGNKTRYDPEQSECIVSKIGRKYFYVKRNEDSWSEIQFYIKNWIEKTDYSCDYLLFENRQAWENSKLVNKYKVVIRELFDYSSSSQFTLEQLQKVAEILGVTT